MTIELQGLVVFGHHGYLEEERRLGQRFLVDLWVDVAGDATETDRIDETVDYRRLAALVREVFAGPERLLLEGLAGAVVDGIVEAVPVGRARACARPQARRRARPARRPRGGHRRAHARVTLAYVGLGANLGAREETLQPRRRAAARGRGGRRARRLDLCARPSPSASSTSRRS